MEKIIGVWNVIKSEIPNYELGEESFEFNENSDFIIKFKGYEIKYKYEITENRFQYYKTETKVHIVTFRIIGNIMIMQANHGFRTYLKRAPRYAPSNSRSQTN